MAAQSLLYAWLFPGMLSATGFVEVTQNWFPLALVAMARALPMLNGGITLAIGPLVRLGAVVAATATTGPAGAPPGVLLVLGAGVAIGAATVAIVALARLSAIIVTPTLSLVPGGAALLILSTPGGAVPPWLSKALAGDAPVAFGLRLALPAARELYLATPAGRAVHAEGEEPAGAFRSRVAVERTQILACSLAEMPTTLADLVVAAPAARAGGAGDRPGQGLRPVRLRPARHAGTYRGGGRGTRGSLRPGADDVRQRCSVASRRVSFAAVMDVHRAGTRALSAGERRAVFRGTAVRTRRLDPA